MTHDKKRRGYYGYTSLALRIFDPKGESVTPSDRRSYTEQRHRFKEYRADVSAEHSGTYSFCVSLAEDFPPVVPEHGESEEAAARRKSAQDFARKNHEKRERERRVREGLPPEPDLNEKMLEKSPHVDVRLEVLPGGVLSDHDPRAAATDTHKHHQSLNEAMVEIRGRNMRITGKRTSWCGA